MNINDITYYGIISVIKKHYSTDDLEMKPSLITNMMQRKDISKYIYKYFIVKDEKENVVKGIVKCEQKLDTELDGSMFFLFPFCVITCYLEVYDAEF
jgi:molybdopterin biosynthesis enzyme MoaB